MPHTVTFDGITPDDLPFLRALYGSTREEELAPTGWTPEQKEAFLDQQFNAQHTHYQANYPDASFDLVLRDGKPIGRLYVRRGAEAIHVIDIALMPEARGQGLGTELLTALLEEGDATGRTVGIHVEKFNPALRLYLRLGFEVAADRGVYFYMERQPVAEGQKGGEEEREKGREGEGES